MQRIKTTHAAGTGPATSQPLDPPGGALGRIEWWLFGAAFADPDTRRPANAPTAPPYSEDVTEPVPAEPDAPRPRPGPRTLRFWEELWVYMWAAALIGTWWELLLSIVLTALTGDRYWWRQVGPSTILHFAEPYGIGAAVVILAVIPLQRRFHLAPLWVFVVNAIMAGVVEASSALAIVAVLGRNPFWDFATYPYNLMGLTSVASTIVFGLFATPFVYSIYPATAPLLDRVPQRRMTWLCVLMLLFYVVALVAKLRTLGVEF